MVEILTLRSPHKLMEFLALFPNTLNAAKVPPKKMKSLLSILDAMEMVRRTISWYSPFKQGQLLLDSHTGLQIRNLTVLSQNIRQAFQIKNSSPIFLVD